MRAIRVYTLYLLHCGALALTFLGLGRGPVSVQRRLRDEWDWTQVVRDFSCTPIVKFRHLVAVRVGVPCVLSVVVHIHGLPW